MLHTLITVLTAIGFSFSNSTPESIPTSLCNDPLLGPAFIIHTDCTDQTDDSETITVTTVTTETTVTSTPAPETKKNKCNKGSGNGAENCDPGKHPENGNNDEGGDRRPENSNGNGKNKKDK